MNRSTLLSTVVVAFLTGVMAAACRAPQSKVPDEPRATAEQPLNQPITVVGCLRSGVADNTFVLHAAKTEGSFETATYQLIGTEGVHLRDHVGEQVEISGTLRSQQQVTSSGKVEEKPAKGTSGTPVVETKTELDVKKLDVTSVKPSGNRCSD